MASANWYFRGLCAFRGTYRCEMSPVISADLCTTVEFDVRLNVAATLAPLRLSSSDPSSARHGDTCWKALRTPDGPATVAVRPRDPHAVEFWAWGDGSALALEQAPDWLGLDDPLEAFDPSPHPVVARLARDRVGHRMGRFGMVSERLVPAILGQLVVAQEAKRSYRRLLQRFGEPAPGPVQLVLAPSPLILAELASFEFHRLGVERKRAETVKRIAREASRLDRLMYVPLSEAYRYLQSLRGIGPWTAAKVGRSAFGDPDVVVVGDYNLPHSVSWALAGKRRSNDEEMLELLEPFAGHRGRVQAMLKSSAKPPRRGPKTRFREIEGH